MAYLLAVERDTSQPLEFDWGREEPWVAPPQARPLLSHQLYHQVLVDHVPEYVQNAGIDGLRLVCRCLDEAMRYTQRTQADRSPLILR